MTLKRADELEVGDYVNDHGIERRVLGIKASTFIKGNLAVKLDGAPQRHHATQGYRFTLTEPVLAVESK